MPWKYLGLLVTNTQIVPQPVKLDIEVKLLLMYRNWLVLWAGLDHT